MKLRRRALYAALAALFVLHNDLPLWGDARLVFGLPAGLVYHLAFCAAAALVMAGLVTWAWPRLDGDDGDRESGRR